MSWCLGQVQDINPQDQDQDTNPQNQDQDTNPQDQDPDSNRGVLRRLETRHCLETP